MILTKYLFSNFFLYSSFISACVFGSGLGSGIGSGSFGGLGLFSSGFVVPPF